MIQLQARITAQDSQPLELRFEILDGVGANEAENKIARSMLALLRKQMEYVAGKTGMILVDDISEGDDDEY